MCIISTHAVLIKTNSVTKLEEYANCLDGQNASVDPEDVTRNLELHGEELCACLERYLLCMHSVYILHTNDLTFRYTQSSACGNSPTICIV